MSNSMNRGSLFDPHLVSELVTKVQGKSALATLSASVPVAFNGSKEYTFSMDSDIDVVAESGAKSHGGITVEPVTITPIKVEYGARVSDEFLYATEEENIAVLQAFSDGFAKMLARGLDKMAFHGLNPRRNSASNLIGTNNFDSMVTQTVQYSTIDDDIEAAIALVEGSDRTVSGVAISTAARTALAARADSSGNKLYPEFMFGGAPAQLGANALAINSTVADDYAIVGDFATMFKWGIAKEIPLEVIEYGDPDNSGSDLKGHNQVYLRAEAYIGWAILDPDSFARVIPTVKT